MNQVPNETSPFRKPPPKPSPTARSSAGSPDPVEALPHHRPRATATETTDLKKVGLSLFIWATRTRLRAILTIGFVLFMVGSIWNAISPRRPAQGTEVHSVKDFESSAFSRKYPAESARSWALKSGGTNFSYLYVDSENDSSCGVELSPDAQHITRYGISWYGESKQQPATLTRKREAFLRELVSSLSGNNLDGNAVVEYVKMNQSKRYPGGTNTAPQADIGKYRIKAGVVGSSLIVVLDTP